MGVIFPVTWDTSLTKLLGQKKEKCVSPPAGIAEVGFTQVGRSLTSAQKRTGGYCIGAGYRKLPILGGMQLVPEGEEKYEAWMEQAIKVEEWDIPDTQKRQRVRESLKGPAAEAIRSLTLSRGQFTVRDYLSLLHDEFGSVETVFSLLFRLEHMYQKRGEKLSEYIRCLNRLLYQVVEKGGLDPAGVEQARIEQLSWGALASDPVRSQIKVKARGNAWGYHEPIRRVRAMEVVEGAKEMPAELSVGRPLGPGMRKVREEDNRITTMQTEILELTKMIASWSTVDGPPLEAGLEQLMGEIWVRRSGIIIQ
ncbi:paraneoplastic antigen Ma1 homolog [Crotalus tigris]|uniref:paraneoplastic antigen Ma1 homolog n=1 Tax=Crotalus tigris TaxID=88082 RepID=UPI00192F2AAB|nr:paraneoplastic antigen Ma1 homolog [Crotalus tigris]